MALLNHTAPKADQVRSDPPPPAEVNLNKIRVPQRCPEMFLSKCCLLTRVLLRVLRIPRKGHQILVWISGRT